MLRISGIRLRQKYQQVLQSISQTTWETTADAEKPAIIAILAGVVVAQVAIGATMSVVDKMPFFGDFFELVGLAVLATFTYRYVTDPSERYPCWKGGEGAATGVGGRGATGMA